jgi:hypothetical protein
MGSGETELDAVMPYSFVDHQLLQTHGFLDLYDKYRDRLLTIASGTYERLKKRSGIPPPPDYCEVHIEIALVSSNVFANIIVDLCSRINFPNPRDPYWLDFFAGAVARYVTDREWPDIAI